MKPEWWMFVAQLLIFAVLNYQFYMQGYKKGHEETLDHTARFLMDVLEELKIETPVYNNAVLNIRKRVLNEAIQQINSDRGQTYKGPNL
jgi:hypothetical protein